MNKRLGEEEFLRFLGDLASMARAGVPLPEGLRRLGAGTAKGNLPALATELASRLEKGEPLAEAFRGASVRVPASFVALVECAGISGDTHAFLDFALEHGRRIQRHRAAMSGALAYPVLVAVACILVFTLLANTVIPRVQQILESAGASAPWATVIVARVASLFSGTGGALGAAVLIALLVSLVVVEPLRNCVLNALGSLPGFRRLLGLSDTAVVSRFLAVMLARGVPLHTALLACRDGVTLGSTRRSLDAMSSLAEKGQPVGVKLGAGTPATAAWLFRQGEGNGSLPEACSGIAEYCEDQFEMLSHRMSALLEPVALLLIGFAITFVLIGIYNPLFMIPRMIGVPT